MRYPFAILLLSAAGVCAEPQRDFSPAAGRAAARQDIASGHTRIYIAGTEATAEVGVDARDRALLAGLPRDHSLPIGCTVAHAPEATKFARAYNSAIIDYLRHAKSR